MQRLIQYVSKLNLIMIARRVGDTRKVCFFSELHKRNYRMKIREIFNRERMCRVMPMVHTIISASINHYAFNIHGIDYLFDYAGDISTEMNFIISKIIK